jgi:hypothetical protein
MPKDAMSQVTIGSSDEPQAFSVLELISGGDKGMRLPQLSTPAIDNLGDQIRNSPDANYRDLARGLTIYDSTQNCVKYWKGTDEVWVGIGCPPPPPAPTNVTHAQTACTVGDLLPNGSGFKWYAVAVGGTALTAATSLSNGTYHVSQIVDGVESEC